MTETTPPAETDDCKHLKGTWERQGRWTIILCEKGDSRTIIDIDSPEAYQLFEGISGAVQQFGNPAPHRQPRRRGTVGSMGRGGIEAAMTPAETTRKSLAAFVESTIKFRMNGMAEVLGDSDPDSMAHGELRIRMDEDKAILGVLRSFKDWNSDNSSESLTGLKEAVEKLRTQTFTMIADDGMDEKRFEFVKKVEVLKLIEERE